MAPATISAVGPISASTPPVFGGGTMGPPSKPAEKATRESKESKESKEMEYDVTDSLAGTGIDLRVEEQFMANLYSFDSATSHPHHHAGNRITLYGGGAAAATNLPAGANAAAIQTEIEASRVMRAWEQDAQRKAQAKTQQVPDPFLTAAAVHARADRIARDHGLELIKAIKTPAQSQTSSRFHKAGPDFQPQPTISITTKLGPDSAVVRTYGSWLPPDCYLADQISLLSLGMKQRLRILVGDANRLMRNRQATSHGEVPEGWATAAAPLRSLEGAGPATATALASAAVANPNPNPLKRPLDPGAAESSGPPTKMAKLTSSLPTTLREIGRSEREWEEARLRKRNRRKEGSAEPAVAAGAGAGAAAGTGPGSVAPATAGSVAPDPDKGDNKPMSKKELKRTQSMKATEAASHANQNMTSSMFSGLPRAGFLFGKNKGKGKTYDWMNTASGSGSLTPTRTGAAAAMASPTAGGGLPDRGPASNALTADGRNRMGAWREDRDKGKRIQLRDWVAVLESEDADLVALQNGYSQLDGSDPQ